MLKIDFYRESVQAMLQEPNQVYPNKNVTERLLELLAIAYQEGHSAGVVDAWYKFNNPIETDKWKLPR